MGHVCEVAVHRSRYRSRLSPEKKRAVSMGTCMCIDVCIDMCSRAGFCTRRGMLLIIPYEFVYHIGYTI